MEKGGKGRAEVAINRYTSITDPSESRKAELIRKFGNIRNYHLPLLSIAYKIGLDTDPLELSTEEFEELFDILVEEYHYFDHYQLTRRNLISEKSDFFRYLIIVHQCL